MSGTARQLACALAPLLLGALIANEEALLNAGDAAAGDGMGRSIALSGDTAVVGTPTGDAPSAADSGSAYVFLRAGTTWSEEAELNALDAELDDNFGYSVAVSGETAVVGAYGEDTGGADAGAAYVFVRSGTTWSQQQKLASLDLAAGDLFGYSVAVNGDTAVIGALLEDAGGADAGAAYVFVRSGVVWSEQQKLVASDAVASAFFGVSVKVQGDTALVGANGDDDAASDAGAAYVFVRSGTTWSEQQKLLAADAASGDAFGGATSLSGETAVLGAPQDDDAGAGSGSAYVFLRSGTTWSQQQKLFAADAAAGDAFGTAVSIDGDLAAAGARSDDDDGSGSGSAYVFLRDGTTWSQAVKITASDAAAGDSFGTSVSLAADTVVVGANGDDNAGAGSGSGYAFRLADPFPSFCDGADGAHASCPCANVGDPDAGCDIAQATGGVRLTVLAQAMLPNRATVQGDGYPSASSPAAVVIRAAGLDSAAPVAFGDGLRCIGTPLVRLAGAIAAGGTSTHTFGHGVMGGGTFYYQLWFRNTPGMFCTPDGFNLSNGRQLTW